MLQDVSSLDLSKEAKKYLAIIQHHLKKVEKQIVTLKKKREECNMLQQPTEYSEKLFRNSQSKTAKLEEKFEEERHR